MTPAKLPTRREIRATILSAMSTTLDNDATGTGAGYLYDCTEGMGPKTESVYVDRVKSVAAELAGEFDRRAAKLRGAK